MDNSEEGVRFNPKPYTTKEEYIRVLEMALDLPYCRTVKEVEAIQEELRLLTREAYKRKLIEEMYL